MATWIEWHPLSQEYMGPTRSSRKGARHSCRRIMLGQLFDTEAMWRCSGKGWRRDSRLVAVFLGDAPNY